MSDFAYIVSGKRNIKACNLLVLVILLAGLYIVSFEKYLYDMAAVRNLRDNVEESPEFRMMALSSEALEAMKAMEQEDKVEFGRLLAVFMLDNRFDLTNVTLKGYTAEDFQESLDGKMKKRPAQMEALVQVYKNIWSDLAYFPVPESTTNKKASVSYENSWLAERTYGGKRGHEGTDIMAGLNEPGYYPVVSMTDGVVEQIGWLKKGGWRIGIRSPRGTYFYYAHLAGYAEGLKAGDTIRAGELLGYMGNTGYSEIEGTAGNFDVHLHVGMYIKTANYQELSINPYWVLRYMEDKKLRYAY